MSAKYDVIGINYAELRKPDGFLYAYWRRPAAYLDPHVRSGSSSFWAIGYAAEAGLEDLRRGS
jgi:hypothetical protein